MNRVILWTAILGVTAVLIGLGRSPMQPAQQVSAERFELLDSNGKVRGEWYVDKDEKVVFSLLLPSGERGVTLSTGKEGSSVIVAQPSGKGKVAIEVEASGKSAIRFSDSDKTRMELVYAPGIGTSFALNDKKLTPRWTMGVLDAEGPFMRMFDRVGGLAWFPPGSVDDPNRPKPSTNPAEQPPK